MAMTIHCDVVSAEEEIFSGRVTMVVATGTMGELTPVRSIDGRELVPLNIPSVFSRLREAFRERTLHDGTPLPEWHR